MRDLRILVMLANFLLQCQHVQPYGYTRHQWLENDSDELHMRRLAGLLRAIVSRGEQRFAELTRVKTALDRVSFDQRRSFEKGYVMGDVIETYRKAVVYTQKQLALAKREGYTEMDRLRFMKYVQDAYIKTYHLVHMMHEINPKFGSDNTGQITQMNLGYQMQGNTPTFYNMAGFNHAKTLNDIRAERHKQREDKILKEKKERLIELEIDGTVKPGTIKKTTNWWPEAYGWDIEYYW